jgi:dihydroorotate dehydrogenase (NAD+) catalytic subunit
LYSPTVKPITLNALNEIADLKLDVPLIACGGIHSADDAREFLAAGAAAIQVDSAAWVDPSLVARMAGELNR